MVTMLDYNDKKQLELLISLMPKPQSSGNFGWFWYWDEKYKI